MCQRQLCQSYQQTKVCARIPSCPRDLHCGPEACGLRKRTAVGSVMSGWCQVRISFSAGCSCGSLPSGLDAMQRAHSKCQYRIQALSVHKKTRRLTLPNASSRKCGAQQQQGHPLQSCNSERFGTVSYELHKLAANLKASPAAPATSPSAPLASSLRSAEESNTQHLACVCHTRARVQSGCAVLSQNASRVSGLGAGLATTAKS